MKWERLSCGALRFRGTEAMRVVFGLVHGDSNYTWSMPEWPYYWIDVYPKNPEAQNLLIEVVSE